jgi:hypothetical protein
VGVDMELPFLSILILTHCPPEKAAVVSDAIVESSPLNGLGIGFGLEVYTL